MSPSFFKPKQSINRSSNDNLLGDLLVKAQVISRKQLDECVRLAGSKRLHLGQMLIMSGNITPRDLQAAVDAQSQLRDKSVDQELAIKCLRIACQSERSFAQVVQEQQLQNEEDEANLEWTLGHLLFEAEAVNKEQLDAAVQRSYATGIPMGRILVLNNAIDEMLLSKSLDLMVRLRDGTADREQAVEAIKVVIGAAQESPATQSLLQPPTAKKIRLGELMVRSGLMSESDVLNAVELGLTYKVVIGQIMVEQGYVAPDIVEAAVETQDYIERGQVTVEQAVETLGTIIRDGGTVSQVLGALQEASGAQMAPLANVISFEKLLTLARVINAEQVEEAFAICRQTPEALAKILRLTGIINQPIHDSAIRCHQLMTAGSLSQDDALVALDYLLNKTDGSRTFDDVLHELGWTGGPGAAPLAGGKLQSSDASDAIVPAAPPVQPEPAAQPDASSQSGGFNLLAHFGLNEGEAPPADATQAPQETAEDEGGWANDDQPGTVAPLDEVAQAAEDNSLPTDSNSRLVGILGQMAEEETGQNPVIDSSMLESANEMSESETIPGNGQSSLEEPRVDLAAMLERESGEQEDEPEPKSEPEPEPETAPASVPFDREKLKELEKTVAPSGLKMENVLTAPQDDGGVDTEKKEAVTEAMYRLAESYFEQGDYKEAQKSYEKILAIKQKNLGAQDPQLVDDLNKLAEVLWVQGNFRAAEPFVRRSVAILEGAQPMDMLKLAESVRTLAGLYFQQGKYEPCLPLLEHALMMKRMELGEDHKDVGATLREYAKLLKKLGRKAEAESNYKQAKAILAKHK